MSVLERSVHVSRSVAGEQKKKVEKLLVVDCYDSNGEEMGGVELILVLAPRRPIYCSVSVHETKSLAASSIEARFVLAVFPRANILHILDTSASCLVIMMA